MQGNADFTTFDLFCILGNEWYAKDTSKKVRAVFKAKAQSGKPLGRPPYGYKKSEAGWEIDEKAAETVRRIFGMYISGKSIKRIIKTLSAERIPTPLAHQKNESSPFDWSSISVRAILKNLVYAGHTVNFKTHKKSYKSKKKVYNPRSEWLIFENTHPAIISQHDYDLAQEILNSNQKAQKCEEINIFSGIVYCSDCGKKLHINRGKGIKKSQEHMKCATYTALKGCSAHYIRTAILEKVVLNEINYLLDTVRENEDEFIQKAMEDSAANHIEDLKKAKKTINKSEKRIGELDKIIAKLYEDNVLGKISDERFQTLSKGYDEEQKQLKQTVSELSEVISDTEQKTSHISKFVEIVRKFEHIEELTPDIIHEMIEKIVVYAPDKSSGHRVQQIDIHYKFNVAVSTVFADNKKYRENRKAA